MGQSQPFHKSSHSLRRGKMTDLGSQPPFAAFAQQKTLADTLSVRFLRAGYSISHLQ
ncbi:MAG: hypothetical protein ACI9TZ_003417, partial [Yoonia sp.]